MARHNHQLPQSTLGSKTPMRAMKAWYQEHPDLFHKLPLTYAPLALVF